MPKGGREVDVVKKTRNDSKIKDDWMNRDGCGTRWGIQFRDSEKSRPGTVERPVKKETKDCGEVGNDEKKQKDWKETTDGCVNWNIRDARGKMVREKLERPKMSRKVKCK